MENIIDLTNDGGIIKNLITSGFSIDHPIDGCKVSIHYTIKYTSGEIFDSTLNRSNPFEFILGTECVFRALDVGIRSMRVGEKCELKCSREYFKEIIQNSESENMQSITIEIDLLNWKGEDLSPENDGSIERFIIEKSNLRHTPKDSAFVKIRLNGLYDGRIFDERDVAFAIGNANECSDNLIVQGIEIALTRMKLGEKSKLIIKSKYAFKEDGNKLFDIPPNATVEYIVTLLNFERSIDDWTLEQNEYLNQSILFKERGNDYFANGKYDFAKNMYIKSSKYLMDVDMTTDEFKNVKIAVTLNLAIAYMKLKNFVEAQKACNIVLDLDPKNVKGLCRRGDCFMFIKDFENALIDFKKIHEIDPLNKSTIQKITICKNNIKDFILTEKQTYAKMFGGGSKKL